MWPWVNAFPSETPQPFWKTVMGAARYTELGFSLIVGIADSASEVDR